MTTNKQDELYGTAHTIDDVVHDALSEVFCRDCEHPRCLNKVKLYSSAIQDIVNSEVLRVLTDILEHRSLLSDPQHGEKSVPVSVIKAKLKEYEL